VIELAPPRGGAAPAPLSLRDGVRDASVALLAMALFWFPLLSGGGLEARDWASHHWHYSDWVRTALREHGTLPLYMADAWVTKNFLANAESPATGPLVPLLWVLPTDTYLKLLLLLFGAAGLAGCYRLLRDLEVSAPVAAAVSPPFAFGGFFVSHWCVGHPWALGGQLLPWLLLLYRRAALGSRGALWAAAGLDAGVILMGQHQPFVWQNLFLGGFALLWSLRVRAVFPLSRLALLWLAAAGFGAVKLLPMLAEFAAYAPEARIAGLPWTLLPASLVGPGQSAGLGFPQLAYAHGAGWWEYAFYVGPVAALGLLAGLAATRRCWPLLGLGVFFLWLALEWPVAWLDLWSRLEGLPVWRTQRAPSRFLFPALFAFQVAAALGLERLYRGARRRWPGLALVAVALLGLGSAADLFAQSLPWQRAAVGPGLQSRDHRPRPLRSTAADVRAELVGFAPNRLVYRVDARRATELALPLRYGTWSAEWQVEGLPTRERGGKLAIQVPAGERDLVLHYRPPLFREGLALSAATLAIGVGSGLRRRRP
jgi:hypothetical protein